MPRLQHPATVIDRSAAGPACAPALHAAAALADRAPGRCALVLVLAAALLAGGCASVVNDSTHALRVETLTAAGERVEGADCQLVNDHGVARLRSGEATAVRRSASDLDIRCTHPQQPEARGRAISRANAGMYGNILIGGGIGALVDHHKGTAYSYPTWVQLIFGRSLVFDRSAQRDGQPTPGTEPAAVAVR